MRKSLLIFVVFIMLSFIYSSAFAQSQQISSGISWLNSSQTATGNWPAIKTNEYYSTATALDTVYALESTSPIYSAGLQWMEGQLESPTDYLSRRIIALKRAGLDATSEINGLLLYRNGNGSWGSTEGFNGNVLNVLDTVLALQALQAANYSDTNLIGQSLDYLTSNQNPDGGWGLRQADQSTAYVTSIVLKTLSSYNAVFINQTAINRAATYLLTKQNGDGGFGSSPSTVYDTALSLMSLIESGQGSIQNIQSGINYLTSTQLADGSWDEDPYSTALALHALASACANLAISSTDISLSKSMPQENEAVTITATVHNTGFDSASNIVVRFYLGDPLAGGMQIGTDQVIPLVALGSSSQVSTTTSFTGTGGKTIFAVVDPDNLLSETSKADNKSSTRIWVATAPDLAVFSEDLNPSTSVPASGAAFTLEYKIRNLGESSADAFTVSLYDGNPAQGGVLLQTANISGLNGAEIRTGTLGATLTTNGNHTLYLVADSGNAITESSKTNNTGTVTVNVGGTQTLADLAVTPMDITLTPARPHAGDTVNISATVRNIGTDAANNFTVELFDGAPESGGVLIASQSISLAAGGAQAITVNWTIATGIHDIYVIADRANQINETNRNNSTQRKRT